MTVPNALSVFRIVLVPFIAVSCLRSSSYRGNITTALLVLVSGLTDFIDGYIARRFNSISELGKLLDPFADKLTQVALAVCLAVRVPKMVYLLSIFMFKELIMIGAGAFLLIKKNVTLDGAHWFGKVATFVFYAVMFAVIIIPCPSDAALWVLIGISAACTVFSFIMYIPVFFRLYNGAKTGKNAQTKPQ